MGLPLLAGGCCLAIYFRQAKDNIACVIGWAERLSGLRKAACVCVALEAVVREQNAVQAERT